MKTENLDRPPWLTLTAHNEEDIRRVKSLLDKGRLNTVCENADCPNIGECFGNKTCTFMILGNICTRNCRFCAVHPGKPDTVNIAEPYLVARTAKRLGLRHVVVTSVTRDDLNDGGASFFAQTIQEIRRQLPHATVEVLIPDFQGSKKALRTVLDAQPDILNHNIETVPRLYPAVRPQANYQRSLELLRSAGDEGLTTKSGLMLGLGETVAEILQALDNLYAAGCKIATLGQYLSPTSAHLKVAEYIHPDMFDFLKREALKIGFWYVSSSPLTRSSYQAGCSIERLKEKTQLNEKIEN